MSPETSAPQILAGRIVSDLLVGKLTREKADALLLPLNYVFCQVCFAHRPIDHEDHLPDWKFTGT